MADEQGTRDRIREAMYAIAALEPAELAELERLVKKRDLTTHEDRGRLFELIQTRDEDRARVAFILVTSKKGARTIRRERRERERER